MVIRLGNEAVDLFYCKRIQQSTVKFARPGNACGGNVRLVLSQYAESYSPSGLFVMLETWFLKTVMVLVEGWINSAYIVSIFIFITLP